jgi:hypothetical protein
VERASAAQVSMVIKDKAKGVKAPGGVGVVGAKADLCRL